MPAGYHTVQFTMRNYKRQQLLGLLLVGCLCGTVSSLDKSTLQQVNIIVRHGARSPTNPFPKDIYKDYWPQGYGQLTKVGVQQMHDVGVYLKKQYTGFLNATYINDEFVVRSSNWDRTLMAAESLLSGLYPPNDAQSWTPGIGWQPIPVHTVQAEGDILLDVDNPVCPPYDQMKLDTQQTASYQQKNASWEPYYQRLKDLTGKTDDMDPFGVWDVYDTIYAEQNEGLAIPSWFTDQDEELMAGFFIPWQFDVHFGGLQKGRLKGGPLITEIVGNMQRNMNGTLSPSNRKVFFYVGHDNNVVTTMKITQTYNERYVPVASYLALELHRFNNENFIQMVFRNSSTQETPYVINITVCGGKQICPFDEFVEAVRPYFIDTKTWFQECRPPKTSSSTLVAVVCGVIGVVIIAFLLIGAALYLYKVGVGSKASAENTHKAETTPLLKN